MQLLADDVVIIAAGQLIRQGPVDEVLGSMTAATQVRVRTPQADAADRRAAGAERDGHPAAGRRAAGHRRGRARGRPGGALPPGSSCTS